MVCVRGDLNAAFRPSSRELGRLGGLISIGETGLKE